ncbi:thaumatin-like protein 1 [Senna tora]|uniref:Thaumatin-like protein 1 n=1 Tax=Senna tora TaxID=362788 RepID=A0A834TYS2_9FABA|nr:thaumatin-like protein 1 [Senna tora]
MQIQKLNEIRTRVNSNEVNKNVDEASILWVAHLQSVSTYAVNLESSNVDYKIKEMIQTGQGKLKNNTTPDSVGWSGRVWGRTGCNFDATSGIGKCQTGDCGGRLECDGNGAAPPTSLFEITFGEGNAQDYYDVSMVDGYNLPILAVPQGVFGSGGGCNGTGCVSDLNRACPKELQVVQGSGEEGVKRPNNFVSPPPPYQIEQPYNNEKVMEVAASSSTSSSTILFPFSVPIFIFSAFAATISESLI